MSKLYLIRHAQTKLDPSLPARDWQLEPEAYAKTRVFANKLKNQAITRVITSHEFKAIETGRVIADFLKLPLDQRPDLHEHNRQGVPFMTKSVFVQTIERFFDYPDEQVFGQESATEALERFRGAMLKLIAEFHSETLAIVSHGTVMSLFVNHFNEIDVKTYWQALKMPDLIELVLPSFELL